MNSLHILRKIVKPIVMPKRNFAQVGMVVSTPPRVPCSYGEKILHGAFMIAGWATPIAYFQTQLKVWRRQYISP